MPPPEGSTNRSSIDIHFETLERNSRTKPHDGWGHQCWYVEEVLKTGLIDPNSDVLHIGSAAHDPDRDYGHSYWPLLKKYGFTGNLVGVDAVKAPNVDLVIEFSDGLDSLIGHFPNKVDLILCTSMLEHDRNPVRSIENISKLLRRRGKAIITAPAVQRAHGTVGVYGTYQNFLPDFFYWHCKKNGLRIVEGSFIYMLHFSNEIRRVDGANHHENNIYPTEEAQPYYNQPDMLNIPRIQRFRHNVRTSTFPLNILAMALSALLMLCSRDFRKVVRISTIYFGADMALVCEKV
jgi:SAM-dependent methyltransferase